MVRTLLKRTHNERLCAGSVIDDDGDIVRALGFVNPKCIIFRRAN